MHQHLMALGIQVTVGPDGDPEEIAQVTSQLRRELLDLDVEAVETSGAGAPPPGSRAVDVAAIGTLVVTLADSQVFAAVVAMVHSWLAGSSRRRIKLELNGDSLELTGVSSSEQRRLADEWLDRHTPRE